MRKKVLLGMSGGIDSSVAAMMLQNRGFEVKGITFVFSGKSEQNLHHSSYLAKSVSEQLGIEHTTIDLRKEFNELVIKYFVDEYSKGKTPFPCAVCNPQLKFYHLEKLAETFSCEFISTGHYVKIAENKGIKYISAGKDKSKDQAFFLWGLKRDLIEKLIFPLGNFYKKDIRKYAIDNGYRLLNEKKESLGICFIDGNNYRNFIYDNRLGSEPGNFINRNGMVLGRHKGIYHYTIGQRRGLGIQVNKPLFVSEIRVKTNEVVLSDFEEMYRNRIFLKGVHFVNVNFMDFGKLYAVKIRYRLQENLCKIKLLPGNKAVIELHEPVAMVSNGQTAVIYDEDRVVGGGFIEGSE